VAPPPSAAPTIEQIRYLEGLKTATRGVAQIRDGLNRVVRTQRADSLTRRRAARRLGGLCGTARSFIASGRPKMQATAYADSMRVLAKQLTTRLDSLTKTLPICEQTAGRDPTVATTLTGRLKNYDDALLAFRTALKPDSTKANSQQ
jgi:ABC-type transporter Mla subunit MlaD